MKAQDRSRRLLTARRRGIAMMMALVALAMLGALLGAVAWEMNADRRILADHQHRIQATWLARAGLETAFSQLLTGNKSYTGESLEIIPASQVRIQVQAEPNSKEAFLITSTAKYPIGRPPGPEITIQRHVKLIGRGGKAQIEIRE